MDIDIIVKYFPNITSEQKNKFSIIKDLYLDWNNKVNLVSRKDINYLYERHILHSMSISKIILFKDHTDILDVGTGGGFPGIPLAILFPKCNFTLVDSIKKKIKIVEDISKKLDLKNVTVINDRVENIKSKFDFIVSRAVTKFPEFLTLIKNKVSNKNFNDLKNGVIYLKGGDFEDEIKNIKNISIYHIKDFFFEEFFQTKNIIYHNIDDESHKI